MLKTLSARGSRLLKQPAGYSAIEMMAAAAIMSVVGGMTVAQLHISQPVMKGDGAMRVVIGQLNTARELSITQRRRMQLTFAAPGTLQISRVEVPGPGTTVLSAIPLEGGVQFGLLAGVPDTPEAFGMGAAVDFGAAGSMHFNTDGTLIDGATGAPINGTIFFLVPNMPRSFRAVTIMGSTGRVRGYRWNGSNWEGV
jgi:hypothetical protein